MPLPSVAVVVVVVVLAGVWVVRSERRRAREKAQLLTSMGFRPLEQPEPRLAEALLALYRRGRSGLQLRKAFIRDAPAGHLVVFDAVDPGSRRRFQVASDAVGLVRPGARLPHFEICAYSAEAGLAGQLMVRVISEGLGHGRALRFDDLPEFNRQFTVLATVEGGEEAVRGCLTAGVRQALLGSRFLILAAGGEALALQGNPASAANRGDELGLLRALVDEAGRLARVLEPGSTAPGAVAP